MITALNEELGDIDGVHAVGRLPGDREDALVQVPGCFLKWR
jgi:hypothetical protein